MPRPWWRIPLYPVVFASALILLTWANAGIHPALLVRPLLVAVGGSLALALVMAAVFNDRHRAGFLVAVVVLFLLATDERLSWVLIALGAALVVEGILRRGRPLVGAELVTTVMTGVALIMALTIGLKVQEAGAFATAVADITRPALPAIGPARPSVPDIYLFLLDAYPGDRAAARSSVFDFDADAFPADLGSRGFEVVRDAHSNYLLTPLTLSSMLWMRHLGDIPELALPSGPRVADWQRLRAALDHAEVFSILRAAGYEVVVLDGGYAHAELRTVDRFIEAPEPAELERALMRTTRLDAMVEAVAPGTVAQLERSRIEWSFRRSARSPQSHGAGPDSCSSMCPHHIRHGSSRPTVAHGIRGSCRLAASPTCRKRPNSRRASPRLRISGD